MYSYIELLNCTFHRTTEWSGSEGTTEDHVVQCHSEKRDPLQVGFEYLQSRRFYNLYGQPTPVLCYPQVLPLVQVKLPVFGLCLLPLVLPLKTVWPHPLYNASIGIDKILSHLSLLKAEQTQLSVFPHKRGAPLP